MPAEGVESLRELECLRLNTSKVPQPFSRRFLRGGTTRALDNAVDRLKLLYVVETCYTCGDSVIKRQDRSASAFLQLCFLAFDSHATLPLMRRSNTQGALHEHLCRQPFV